MPESSAIGAPGDAWRCRRKLAYETANSSSSFLSAYGVADSLRSLEQLLERRGSRGVHMEIDEMRELVRERPRVIARGIEDVLDLGNRAAHRRDARARIVAAVIVCGDRTRRERR